MKKVDPQFTLLNKSQLREALGLPERSKLITAMCHFGFQMPGGKATIAAAHRWLEDHPDISTSRYEAEIKERRESLAAAQD